jgi:phosphoribosylformylglycinamidine (FGAM) synthase-like amidotransferase family enzyme
MPRRDGYYSNWVVLEARGGSLWTEAYAPGERIPMPMAHGEGRFTARDGGRMRELDARGQVPFAYTARADGKSVAWPDNPNGSECNAAGVTNARGNVLALMPHPERAAQLRHVPLDWPGVWGDRRRAAVGDWEALEGPGPGRFLFESLARRLGVPARRAATPAGSPR